MQKVLVIAAHPDDEIIGLGGTILKHIAAGDHVSWLIITSMFEKQGFSAERIAERNKEIKRIADEVGFKSVHKLEFPTMSLTDSDLPALISKISGVISMDSFEVIYTMNRTDVHSDHRIAFDAVMACTKSFRYPSIKKVLMYETLSETEFSPALAENMFIPNYFVDISSYMAKKLELSAVYKSEMGEHPFPRSTRNIEALGTYRGAVCGTEYAEAFQLVKLIDK